MKHVISIRDFSRADLDSLIIEALENKRRGIQNSFSGKKVASLFFENSTRTRVSSETALQELKFYVNGFSSVEGTSVKKGEPLKDTLTMFVRYGYDAIIIRHPLEGAARYAADLFGDEIGIVNAGDGSNTHPTQTQLDLMTIVEKHGKIDGLKIAMVGDLKYGRTTHPLLQALELYDSEVWLVSPDALRMPEWRIQDYQNATGKKPIITDDFIEAIRNVDVIYMTRIQRERFPEGPDGQTEYEKVSGIYNLAAEMLKEANPNLIVMHPLPRYKHNLEISMDVDDTPHAWYFNQAENGLYMREAIFNRVFGKGFVGRTREQVESNGLWQDIPRNPNKLGKIGKRLLYRLDDGTLIDHIEPGRAEFIKHLLGLGNLDTEIVYPEGLNSHGHGIKKGVLAINQRYLTDQQLSMLGLLTQTATVNIIKERKVVRKGRIILPSVFKGELQCQNHNCITWPDHYEHVTSLFYLEQRDPLRMRCHNCERPIGRGGIADAIEEPIMKSIRQRYHQSCRNGN